MLACVDCKIRSIAFWYPGEIHFTVCVQLMTIILVTEYRTTQLNTLIFVS